MSDKAEKKLVSVTLTIAYVEALDRLVEREIYLDHQYVIRDALRRLFRFYGIEPFYKKEPAAPSEP